jgi:2-hydroxycyclohexanecarboxyl-CoA dehydrogenase
MMVPKRSQALVTGGAKGIGEATCRALAHAGCEVTICDIDAVAGEALAAEIAGRFMHLDAADPVAIERSLAPLPPFAILVNNVGVDQHAFLADVSAEQWRALLLINLEAVFAFTKALLPGMQTAGYGRIVNVSSEAGRLGSKGGSIYAAAKAGVIGFTRSIARENARFGITANAVLPGPVMTPLVADIERTYGKKITAEMARMTLLNRLGKPEEIAAAIVFLSSPQASFITGEALGVSGGMGCGSG